MYASLRSGLEQFASAVEDIVTALVVKQEHHRFSALRFLALGVCHRKTLRLKVCKVYGLADCFTGTILQREQQPPVRGVAVLGANHPADAVKFLVEADIQDNIVLIAQAIDYFSRRPERFPRSGASSNDIDVIIDVHNYGAGHPIYSRKA